MHNDVKHEAGHRTQLIEAFKGSLRECLSQHSFASIAEAQQILSHWRADYNTERPHRSLANHSPAERHRGGPFIPWLQPTAQLHVLVVLNRGHPPL